jgi:hypothetical protein
MPGAVLAKVDRMSMQHSLEVRAPLLGVDVARFAMTLAADDCYQDWARQTGAEAGRLALRTCGMDGAPETRVWAADGHVGSQAAAAGARMG